jgi:hypothetical protein
MDENSSLKEVMLMPAPSHSPSNIPESVVLRWAMKAFLLGLFLGAAAAVNALFNS